LDARQTDDNTNEYLIQWEGFPLSEQCWVAENDLHCEELLKAFWIRKEEEKKLTKSEYEVKRKKQFEANKKLLKELGISPTVLIVKSPEKRVTPTKPKVSPIRASPRSYQTRSLAQVSEEDVQKDIQKMEKTQRHFTGGRVYDSVEGVTCHQCRQKTLDEKSTCVNEDTLATPGRHRFCEMCLRTRYGEELKDVLQDSKWQCPFCRGICNCSFCRKAHGRAPTGIIYHVAKSNGYSSAAQYLKEEAQEEPDQ